MYDPTSKSAIREAKAIEQIMSRYRRPWALARDPYVRQFLLNTAYVKGHQYSRLNGWELEPIPNRKNVVRMTINHMRQIEDIKLSMVTRNKPLLDIQPESDDFVEEQQTIVGRKMLRALERICDKKKIDRLLFKAMFRGGTAFKRIFWDEGGGPLDEGIATDGEREYWEDLKDAKIRTGEEVDEIMADMIEANPDVAEEELFKQRFRAILVPSRPGEVSLDVLTVAEVIAPPIYCGLRESPAVIIERWRSMDFIRKLAPERAKYVQPEGDPLILFEGSGGSRMLPGAVMHKITGDPDNQQDGAVVRELIIKPTESNPLMAILDDHGEVETPGPPAPLGIHFIWAGNIALTDLDTPMPYAITPQTADHDLDFDIQDYRFREEFSMWGDPMHTDFIPLQQAKNRTESQIRESINAFIYPKVLVPIGSKIRKGAFADMPEVIEFAGVPPSYLQPPSLASYVFKSKEDILRDMNDLSMLHEVSRQGQVPANVRTAAGLMRLQESDNLATDALMEMYEAAEEIAGQMMLDRVKQFYPAERIVEYIGERNKLETLTFKREPFFRHRWQVFVHPGSSRPDSKAAKLQQFFELIQFFPTFFQDQQTGAPDRALAARFLNLSDLEEYYQDKDESRQAAEQENIRMSNGEFVKPRRYEEDAIHLEVHYKDIRSPDFDLQPQHIQDIKLAHAALHEQQTGEKILSQQQIGDMMAARAGEAARQQVELQAAGAGAASEARKAVREQETEQQPGNNGGAQAPAGTQTAMLQRLMASGAMNRPR